jgi:alpha-L-rhamnosidase
MKRRFFLPAILLLFASFLPVAPAFGDLVPERLRVEYLENPLGLDATVPRLSWVVTSKARGQRQAAYRILVASREDLLRPERADLWDSGKVDSDETLQIAYGGRPLASRQRCYWRVQVWDQDGHTSGGSEPARWEMGLLQPSDWQGRWIGRTDSTNYTPAPLLRKKFDVRRRVARARVYVCGLGYHELSLNGRRVGDALLDPGYTRYDRRVLYLTHDVTELLRPGRNALGVVLGTGWFNCHTKAVWNFHLAPWRMSPRLLLQLHVEYTDGTEDVVVSDESWQTATGPIVFDSIYGGETYDARLERPGWDTATDGDAGWEPARLLPAPAGRLAAQVHPPIRVDRVLPAVAVTEPKPGVFVVDFGQNLAGMAELTVTGAAGTRIQWRYGERLAPDGTLDTRDIDQHIKSQGKEQSFQTDTYILKGVGKERWHARFTYHGFQYLEVTGFRPTRDSFRALFVHSDIPRTGTFACSDEGLNWIQTAAGWAYLSNLQGIPTDCPHREKNGWTGDAHLAAEQANFNFLPVTVQAKWVEDLGDEQRPSGELPGIVPTSGWGYAWGNGPAWDSAYLLLPHYAHLYFGDTAMFRRQYQGLRRYVDYLGTRAKDGIVEIGLNDWAPWKTQTPAAITSTAYYYVDARIVAEAARALGEAADAAKYDALADSIRRAFQARFYQPDRGSYDNGSQTALGCALYQGLVDPADRGRVLANLVAAVEKTGGHIDTGILGAKYLLNALLEDGRAEVAFRVITQPDQPGWLWWRSQGATTLWEQWSGAESRNHIMFGDVSAWFYKALGGLRPDPQSPGFKHFDIRPQPLGDLRWAKAEYDSIRGRIVSHWERRDGRFRLRLTVPANTSATVYLPGTAQAEVREGGKDVRTVPDLRHLRQEGDRVVFDVGSGSYDFSSVWR